MRFLRFQAARREPPMVWAKRYPLPSPRELLPAEVSPRSSRCLCTDLTIQLIFGSRRTACNWTEEGRKRSVECLIKQEYSIEKSISDKLLSTAWFKSGAQQQNHHRRRVKQTSPCATYIVRGIDEDDLKVLVGRVLGHPVRVQHTQSTETTSSALLKESK